MSDGVDPGARQFRWLIWGEGASVLGDQLAKVGVSVLVFQLTGSAALTGLTFALTLLPDLVAGPLLSPLADRFPRRTVMTVSALTQALLAGVMAVPGVPLYVVAIAVAVIAAGQAPYKAAQTVLVRDLLDAKRNKSGQVQLTMIRELGQLAGLAGAAAVVGLVGPTVAIVLNAASFLIAAATVHFGVRREPAREPRTERVGSAPALRAIRADPKLTSLTWLALIGSLTIVPDAVIVPMTGELGAANWVVGPLLAADSVGFLIGARMLQRCSPATQRTLIGPLTVLSLITLCLFVFQPHPILAGVVLAVSGAGMAHLPLLRGEVVELSPRALGGAVTGWVRTALRAGQGAAALGGGLLAELLGSATDAIAITGLLGTAAAGLVAVQWHRERISCVGAVAG